MGRWILQWLARINACLYLMDNMYRKEWRRSSDWRWYYDNDYNSHVETVFVASLVAETIVWATTPSTPNESSSPNVPSYSSTNDHPSSSGGDGSDRPPSDVPPPTPSTAKKIQKAWSAFANMLCFLSMFSWISCAIFGSMPWKLFVFSEAVWLWYMLAVGGVLGIVWKAGYYAKIISILFFGTVWRLWGVNGFDYY